jgi:hypothetical protein
MNPEPGQKVIFFLCLQSSEKEKRPTLHATKSQTTDLVRSRVQQEEQHVKVEWKSMHRLLQYHMLESEI